MVIPLMPLIVVGDDNVLFIEQSDYISCNKCIALAFERYQKGYFNGRCLGRQAFEADIQQCFNEVMVPILLMEQCLTLALLHFQNILSAARIKQRSAIAKSNHVFINKIQNLRTLDCPSCTVFLHTSLGFIIRCHFFKSQKISASFDLKSNTLTCNVNSLTYLTHAAKNGLQRAPHQYDTTFS